MSALDWHPSEPRRLTETGGRPRIAKIFPPAVEALSRTPSSLSKGEQSPSHCRGVSLRIDALLPGHVRKITMDVLKLVTNETYHHLVTRGSC